MTAPETEQKRRALAAVPDQSPEMPGTASSMRLVSLVAFLNCSVEAVRPDLDYPHCFKVDGFGDYIVTEHALPQGQLLHLGSQWGHEIYAIE